MNLTLRVDVGGLERKFELLTDSAKKIDPALRAFDRYLAARVRQRFESSGPGWAPLAPETIEARKSRAAEVLGKKLGRDVRRSEQRYRSKFGEHRDDTLSQLLESRVVKKRRSAAAAIQRRLTTFAEYRRQLAGGSAEASLFEGRGADRQRVSLAARVQRAEARATGKILGRVALSFKSTVRGGRLTRESKIPWAGVHNEGGAAGHGATIPARPFLFIEERDVDVLAEILRDRMLLALGA